MSSILISGAASGIGAATARLFHTRGWRVGLLDVDEKLERMARLRAELARIVQLCDGGPVSDCRVIEAIAAGNA